jgi:multiple sugar transport system ATP-binding protein
VYAELKDGTPITAQDSGRSQVQPGQTVFLKFDTSQLHLFDESGKAHHAH